MPVEVELVGTSAIVTGAGQGIGYAIAGHLMAAGADVLVYEIDAARARAAAERPGVRPPLHGARPREGRGRRLSTLNYTAPASMLAAYCSAKAAVSQFTKVAALEYASMGIRVNAIAPGLVNTELSARFLGESPEVPAAFVRNTPLARVGEPDDQARVVVFLASTALAWMTGLTLVVDGGLHLLGVPDNWELFKGPLGKTEPTPADWPAAAPHPSAG